MAHDTKMLEAILRQDFMSFLSYAMPEVSAGTPLQPNWHHEAIAHQLDQVRAGMTRRLIVTMPPRYLKSITISVAWVAWLLGHRPELSIVCVSYSQDLAEQHARDCRAIMQTDWYQRLFPRCRLAKGRAATADFSTTRGGGRLSTSVGGTLTGRGGNLIIIDDPIKPDEAQSATARKKVIDWYRNTLTSRLNDKKTGSIVLVMQRLHEEDLAGYLLDNGGWSELSLPIEAEEETIIPLGSKRVHVRQPGELLHPEREGPEEIEQLKRSLGSSVFAAQYQQSPVPAEGMYIKDAWFQTYETAPEKQPGDIIVQSWDTASKDGVFNDYSVCITALVKKGRVYLLDVFRDRLKFPELLAKVKEQAQKWGANTLLIEDAASGQQLIQLLKQDPPPGVPRPIAIKPQGDKHSRFSAQTARIEAGDLVLPTDAPWLAALKRELLGFPALKHDDQVDALVQLLAWRKPATSNPAAGMGFTVECEM